MTATLLERETPFAGLVPGRGSYKIAANTLIRKGWMVGLDAAGRAVAADTIANGCISIVGKSSSTIDNRTGSADFSGLADATDVFVEYGVFGWLSKTGGGDDIAQANAGAVVWAVDNQTVALTSNSGARAIAGYCSEVRDGQVYVEMGPTIVGQIVIASAEASELDTAQTDIDTLQTDVAALQVDAATANASFDVPLTAFVDPDGDPLVKYAADNVGTPGWSLVNSEALCLRWNNYPGNPGVTVRAQTALPADLDDAAPIVMHFLTSKTGATAGDTGVLAVAAFILSAGDLNNADSDCGGDASGMVATATTGTTTDQTLTIAAADVPAGARTMSFSLTPKSGKLETDDILLHSVQIRYTRKIQTS